LVFGPSEFGTLASSGFRKWLFVSGKPAVVFRKGGGVSRNFSGKLPERLRECESLSGKAAGRLASLPASR